MSSKFVSLLALVLLLSMFFGCQRQEGITTYTVERETAPRSVTDYEAVARSLDRVLVAILPQGDQAWFFKMAGPAEMIERHRKDFLAFLKTAAPADKSDATPQWQLPKGWEEKGPSSMRAATLVLPGDQPVEIAVSSLPLTDDWNDFLNRNVNRWLGQLGQAPLSGATIEQLVDEVATKAGPATVVELAGVMKAARGANPHAGLANRTAPASSSPPSKPKPAAGEASAEGPLTYDTPAGWQPGQMSMMRKAAFTVADGEQQAEITVIDLPVAGGAQITDVAANVRRWTTQVGMASVDDEQLAQMVEETSIDGTAGSFVALLPPEGDSAMLVVMVERGEKVWFFKLSGNAALVEKQREAFRSFLRSVRFK